MLFFFVDQLHKLQKLLENLSDDFKAMLYVTNFKKIISLYLTKQSLAVYCQQSRTAMKSATLFLTVYIQLSCFHSFYTTSTGSSLKRYQGDGMYIVHSSLGMCGRRGIIDSKNESCKILQCTQCTSTKKLQTLRNIKNSYKYIKAPLIILFLFI